MVKEFLQQYSYVAIFAIVGMLYVIVVLVVSRILAPHNPSPEKSFPYECGLIPVGEPWGQLNTRYYLIALLFVLSDVETVFMYPWAIVFKDLGWPAFFEMFSFIGVIAVGLVYAWKKKVLRWV